MFPKYALFDFFESKTVEVSEVTNIVWGKTGAPSTLDSVINAGTVIDVKWTEAKRRGARPSEKKSSTSIYKAKLLKVHGTLL